MLKIYFNPDSGYYSFVCHSDDALRPLDEFVEITATCFSHMAQAIDGNHKEGYLKLIDVLYEVGIEDGTKELLNEAMEINKSTIFLNNETAEEAVESLIKQVKESFNELEKQYGITSTEEQMQKIINRVIEDSKELYDIDYILKDYNIDDYEDDLF